MEYSIQFMWAMILDHFYSNNLFLVARQPAIRDKVPENITMISTDIPKINATNSTVSIKSDLSETIWNPAMDHEVRKVNITLKWLYCCQ